MFKLYGHIPFTYRILYDRKKIYIPSYAHDIYMNIYYIIFKWFTNYQSLISTYQLMQ